MFYMRRSRKYLRGGPASDQGSSQKINKCKNQYFGNLRGGLDTLSPLWIRSCFIFTLMKHAMRKCETIVEQLNLQISIYLLHSLINAFLVHHIGKYSMNLLIPHIQQLAKFLILIGPEQVIRRATFCLVPLQGYPLPLILPSDITST